MQFSDGYFVRVPVTENSDSLDKLSMKSVSPGWCGLLVFESVWELKLQNCALNVTRGRFSIGQWISQWWGQSAQTLKCCFYEVNHTNRCDTGNQKHPVYLPTQTYILYTLLLYDLLFSVNIRGNLVYTLLCISSFPWKLQRVDKHS